MEEEYQIENDSNLMGSINHYVKISNNESRKFKFVELMKRVKLEDVVFIKDLKLIEREFNCPIIAKLIIGSEIYLGEQIARFSEINRFLGKRTGRYKDCKLDFDHLRKAIIAMT